MAKEKMPEFDEFEADIMKNARKINSLSGQVGKLTDADVKRVSSVKGEEELVSTTVKIMKKMGQVVENMASGIKNVTVGSLKYTKQAVGQYSKSLSEDINIDKKNIMALSLAKSTPIFGYFAAKFMETDVFKDAAQKIKDKMSDAFSVVGTKLKTVLSAPFRGMSNLLKKRRSRLPSEVAGTETKKGGRRGVFSERDGEIHFHPIGKSKMSPMRIPKMAEGGYVEKGGLTRLHPAEVVMPIDKLLDRIDEKIENESDVRMNKMIKGVSVQQMRMLKRYGKTQQEAQSKAFAESYKDQYKSFVEPFNVKMIDAFSDLKTAMLGQPNSIMISTRLMWQRFLGKHPVFLALKRFSGAFMTMLASPFTVLFRRFGGGAFRWVSRRLSSNPLIATSEILSRYAPISLGLTDNILTVLKDSLIVQKDLTTFFTGAKYGPTTLKSSKRWTIAGLITRMISKGVKGGFGLAGKAKRGLFGGGAEEIEEGETRSPITMSDQFNMMINLLKDISESSNKSVKNDTFKGFVKVDGVWQKKSIEVEKKQLHEQKKHRGFFSRMRHSLSFIGMKMKNMAIKIGSVLMSGMKKTLSFFKSTLDTIMAFIPGWMKIGLGLLAIPLVTKLIEKMIPKIKEIVTKISPHIVEIFEKLIPKITGMFKTGMSLIFPSVKELISTILRGDGRTRKEIATERSGQIQEKYEQMKKKGKSRPAIAMALHKEGFKLGSGDRVEALPTESLGTYKQYKKLRGEEMGFGEKVMIKTQLARAQMLRFVGIDKELQLKNLMDEIKKGTMDPDKAGSLYLSAIKKKMSPEAYTMLTKAGPTASAVDNFRTMLMNGTIYKHEEKYITQNQWFGERAGFKNKAVARIGRTIDSKSFGIFKLENQFKEATSRAINAKDMADEQDKKYANYMKEKMTPEAHHLLTKDGNKDIANKLSSMISNNQFIFHDGKLNTAYQFLKKTDQLTWSDRFKTMFGLKEMSPAMMLNRVGTMGLNAKDGIDSFMKQNMPVNPYSTISTADLKNEVLKAGVNTAAYVKELQSRLPTEQASAYMKTIMNNPKIARAMQLTDNIITPMIDKTELASMQAKSAINEQLATIKSNKNVQAGMEKVNKTTGNLANSMSNFTNSMINNVTNNVTATQPQQQMRNFLPVDADERDLTTGDLK